MKQILYLDIDGTLLDTNKLDTLVIPHIAALLGVDPSQLFADMRLYEQRLQRPSDFNPNILIGYWWGHHAIHADRIAAYWYGKVCPQNYSYALYHDVQDALSILSRRFHLGIFSQGFEQYQLAKIKVPGIAHYFSRRKRLIHRHKLEHAVVSQLAPNAIVVDDDLDVIYTLIKYRPDITPVWINRANEPPEEGTLPSKVWQINSLCELLQSSVIA